MTKKTLQQYADEMFDEIGLPQLKQPLKTIEEAFAAHGWKFRVTDTGLDIEPKSLVVGLTGLARAKYEFYDPNTGAFIRDVTGPLGPNFMAPDDVEDPERRDVQGHSASVSWVAGQRAPNDTDGSDPVEETLAPRSTMEKEVQTVLDGIMAELDKPQVSVTPGVKPGALA